MLEAKEAGQSVGEGVGFDSAGEVTTDPAKILEGGAIRNFTRCSLLLSVLLLVPAQRSIWEKGCRCVRLSLSEALHLSSQNDCLSNLCPYRDHKGSGLAFVLELLSGALVGGAIKDKKNAWNWGCLVAAIDPAHFGDPQDFQERVKELTARVKAARKAAGTEEVLIPGERGYREASRVLDS